MEAFLNRPIVLKSYLILLILLVPIISDGQILNIERLRLEKDTARTFLFKTTAGLSAYNRSAAEDNPVNLFGYNVDINAIYYPGKHAYTFVSKFDYLRINESDFLNFGFVHLRANFWRENKINFESYFQHSFDNFRGLDPRWVTGLGIRTNLVKNDKITLVYGLAAIYEFEKWEHPVSLEAVEVNFIKNSNYLSLRATINRYVDCNTINYFQTGYDRSIGAFRNRFSSSTVINTRLTGRFSLTNSFDISYEDKPIVPITKIIFSFKTGLSLDF